MSGDPELCFRSHNSAVQAASLHTVDCTSGLASSLDNIACMDGSHACNNTYTKMNPSTVKWAQ